MTPETPATFNITGDFAVSHAPSNALAGSWIKRDDFVDYLTLLKLEQQDKVSALANEIVALRIAGDNLARATAKFVCSKHYKTELTEWSRARGLDSDLRKTQ